MSGVRGSGPVDAHVHVWDRARVRFDWLDALPDLSASRLPAEYDAQRGDVHAAVFVQAGAAPEDALTEASWVQSLAPKWPALSGIVADADLLRGVPALEAHLDALEQLELYRGVRHLLQDLPRGAVASDALVSGLGVLARRGASFDACVRWWQLEELADAVSRAASLPVILDHVGKPPLADDERDASWASWERGLRRLGALPNVSVKLSGLSAEAGPSSQASFAARVGRVVDTALAVFGPDRCMFGSDWPVSAVGAAGLTTAEWLEFVRARLSDAEWLQVGTETAARAYRLRR
ncbi:amidohydrolase [Pseudoclavibacter sp. AY1H1]|uniref:amidohydrolase family protein n=1 Tax=Pseudoclavibacter sp. AY1H1 TaxID=2080584 RepID=UPI000CE8A1AB|nr:amidohydrolase family protein [Pseudoclavibacter sp. AY1H1]PPF37090.1 amidohydrolase [Pseudoclavibacter sp. AY1H1]